MSAPGTGWPPQNINLPPKTPHNAPPQWFQNPPWLRPRRTKFVVVNRKGALHSRHNKPRLAYVSWFDATNGKDAKRMKHSQPTAFLILVWADGQWWQDEVRMNGHNLAY